jgi:hypothetical protein
VPGGTNTTASDSGAAAGSAAAEQVKPHDKDGALTPVNPADATNNQSAPEAEAAASGGNARNSEPSQGAANAGAGNAAGPGEAAIFGVDLAREGTQDFTVFSWGGLPIDEETYPRTFAFFADIFARHPAESLVGYIRVRAKTDGFRRGGVAHSAAGLTFLPGEISAEQLEAFLGEAELSVEIV